MSSRRVVNVDSGRYEGELSGNLFHGKGIFHYNNRDIFYGEWKNGLKDGMGTFYYDNGDRYEGTWRKGKIEDYGLYYTQSGRCIWSFYTLGEVSEGTSKRIGHVTNKSYNNGRYVGKLSTGNLRNGKGIYYFNSGERYVGDWKDNKMDGYGIYYYKNGNRHQGYWKESRKEYHGILFYNNGSYLNGFWRNGKLEDFSIYDPCSSEGPRAERIKWCQYRDGQLVNSSKLLQFGGEMKIGVRVTDLGSFSGEVTGPRSNIPNGKGIFRYVNLDEHAGEWRDGKREGKGIYYTKQYIKGERYEGTWKNDKKEGRFKHYHLDGRCEIENYRNGQLVIPPAVSQLTTTNSDGNQRRRRQTSLTSSRSNQQQQQQQRRSRRTNTNTQNQQQQQQQQQRERCRLYLFLNRYGLTQYYEKMHSNNVRYENLRIFRDNPESLKFFIPDIQFHRIQFLEALENENNNNIGQEGINNNNNNNNRRRRREPGLVRDHDDDSICGRYNWNGRSIRIERNHVYTQNNRYDFERITSNVYKVIINRVIFMFIWDEGDRMLRVVKTKGEHRFIRRRRTSSANIITSTITGEYNWNGRRLGIMVNHVYLDDIRYSFENVASTVYTVQLNDDKKYVFHWDTDDRRLGIVEVEGENERFFERIERIIHTRQFQQ